MNTKNLCYTAVFTALVFIITRFIQIPIPLGYFNVANCFILIFCCLLPMPYGIVAGSLGSALADLLSYPVYTIPTLIIKALMPALFYLFIKNDSRLKVLAGSYLAMLIPLIGYSIVGMILYGGVAAGMAQVPGLVAEFAANCIIFTVMYFGVEKVHLKRMLI